jgi:GDPmannose 4,6-dehydratase
MRAIITGITGQDGSYLAEFLLSRGYEVHGTVRPASEPHLDRIDHILDRIHLHEADLLDQLSLICLIEEVQPDEVYNLAGPSLPDAGWRHPVMYGETAALGVTRLLEAIRLVDSGIRFFQASSCEMFGNVTESPQTEQTPFLPASPFGAAKLHAHWTTVNYRRHYGMKASSGILYDHESPRRGPEFIARRITRAAARIKLGLQDELTVDTLDLRRDWGFAGDFVRAYWLMLQHPTPDDYIIATGLVHSLRDFCRLAFEAVDLDWQDHVRVRRQYACVEPATLMQGDVSHTRRRLLWEPEVTFGEMIRAMVDADLERYTPSHRVYDDSVSDHPTERARS